jgi:integrase
VTRDTDIKGFALVVTTRRAFWCLYFQPKGLNPATGERWGGGVRHELGDGVMTSVAEARAAALKAKVLVWEGHDPHRQAMASKASAVAERASLPTTLSEALDAYEKAVMARREPSETSRRQLIHYARKGIRLLNAEALTPPRLGASMIRVMVETADGSAGERRHVFGALSRFLSWCRRQELVEHNPCDALDRDERPKPGKARAHVPSLKELRAVWIATTDEPQRDLVCFMLLAPIRRDEAAGLLWSEVDFDKGHILIGADRMKNGQPHELPLARHALALIAARKAAKVEGGDLVFPSGAGWPFDGWNRLAIRIRKRIGHADATKHKAFSFHDVRRSFVSHLAGQFDVDLLDQCLSHTRKGVFGIYQRSSRVPERAAAMHAWDALICGDAQADVEQFAERVSDKLARMDGPPNARGSSVSSSLVAPRPFLGRSPEESVASMRTSILLGALGMAEKRGDYAPTRTWSARPSRPYGFTLTSIPLDEAAPSTEELSSEEPGTGQPSLGEALVWLSTSKRPKSGTQTKEPEDIALVLDCLKAKDGNEEQARSLFIERVKPSRDHSVLSKRFARAIRAINEFPKIKPTK